MYRYVSMTGLVPSTHTHTMAHPFLRPGQRVRFTADVERYPHAYIPAGSLGYVVSYNPDDPSIGCAVHLDEHHDGLDEWDNEIHWHAEDLRHGDHPEQSLEPTDEPPKSFQ